MRNNRESRWAVGLAAAVSITVVLSGAILGIAYLAGGSSAVSDNWVGFLCATALLGGLLVSLFAFVLAVTSRIKHGRSAWLWLPLSVFPVLLAFVVVGETLWWE